MSNNYSLRIPPPIHPSTTPLSIGDVVFSVVSILDPEYCRTIFKTHKYLSLNEITDQFIKYDSSEIARQISSGIYMLINITFIGYIMSERKTSNPVETVSGLPVLQGYTVRWEENTREMDNWLHTFEDETSFICLSDIVILNPQEFYEELIDARRQKANKNNK